MPFDPLFDPLKDLDKVRRLTDDIVAKAARNPVADWLAKNDELMRSASDAARIGIPNLDQVGHMLDIASRIAVPTIPDDGFKSLTAASTLDLKQTDPTAFDAMRWLTAPKVPDYISKGLSLDYNFGLPQIPQALLAGIESLNFSLPDGVMQSLPGARYQEMLKGIEAVNLRVPAIEQFTAWPEFVTSFTGQLAAVQTWVGRLDNTALRSNLEDLIDAASPDPERPVTTADVQAFAARADAAMDAARTAEERAALRVIVGFLIGHYGGKLLDATVAKASGVLDLVMTLFCFALTSPALPPVPRPAALAAPSPGALLLPHRDGWQLDGLPAIVRRAGPRAAERTFDFFVTEIRNPNTRLAYMRAARMFFAFCDDRNLELSDITPSVVAAYIEDIQRDFAAPTVKQHLAAIRMLFDYLVVGQVLPVNPASSVRGPRHVAQHRKTAVLGANQARRLLDSINTSDVVGLRDRAIIGSMVYSFARVSATVGMRVEDYFLIGKQRWFRLQEKGGKRHEVPAHHNAEAYIDEYIKAAGIGDDTKGPMFRTTVGRSRTLTGNRMNRTDVLRMIYRRSKDAGLEGHACCHTFRATGITAYLENGGTLEKARQIAAHESPRTTKLYDRKNDELTLDEIERIAI